MTAKNKLKISLVLVFWAIPGCAQELLLVVFREPIWDVRIKPGAVTCKASSLPVGLSLQLLISRFLCKLHLEAHSEIFCFFKVEVMGARAIA